MNLREFKNLPIIGILRGVEEPLIEPLIDTAFTAGLRTLEITMNTKDAPTLIKKMVKASKGRIFVGAGTVLSMRGLKDALASGASFIVMPTCEPEIVNYCVKNKVPVFPGALTPQEILNAWKLGPTMIKVFPAKFFGASYVKEVKGPLNEIELLACGGITPENSKDFFKAGASAIAFGGSVFKKEWLLNKDFKKIGASIKTLVDSYKR